MVVRKPRPSRSRTGNPVYLLEKEARYIMRLCDAYERAEMETPPLGDGGAPEATAAGEAAD